jgi:hypothetical protein
MLIKKLLLFFVLTSYMSCTSSKKDNLQIEIAKLNNQNYIFLINNSSQQIKIQKYESSCSCAEIFIDTSKSIFVNDTMKIPFVIKADSSKQKKSLVFSFKTNLKKSIYSKEFSLN